MTKFGNRPVVAPMRVSGFGRLLLRPLPANPRDMPPSAVRAASGRPCGK